jgi:hypothetical protein
MIRRFQHRIRDVIRGPFREQERAVRYLEIEALHDLAGPQYDVGFEER